MVKQGYVEEAAVLIEDNDVKLFEPHNFHPHPKFGRISGRVGFYVGKKPQRTMYPGRFRVARYKMIPYYNGAIDILYYYGMSTIAVRYSPFPIESKSDSELFF